MSRESMIQADMERLGIYDSSFDKSIHELAKRERELRRAEKAWKAAYNTDGKKQAPKMTIVLTSKAGTEYTTKDPHYAEVSRLRKEVDGLRKQLGLTPKSLQRVRETVGNEQPYRKSRIEALLENAKAHAEEKSEQYQLDVDRYVNAILSGEIRSCIEIRQACARYQRDLDNPEWDFRPEPANEIIAIIETTICHQQGEFLDATPLRGTPFLLLPYHKFIIYNVMGFWIEGTKERRFKEAFDFVPRKNIKTTFAAALAWALALYERKSGSKVYEVGGALKQALEGFDFLKYNLRRLQITTDEDQVTGLRIINNNMEHSITGDIGDGFISINALASSPDRQDSFNANIVIADEMHTYKSPNQYQVLRDATKAYTNKLIIGISSGGKLAQGFCAKRVEYCRKILNGTIKGAEADRLFIFIAAAEKPENGEVDYTNPEVLESCNPGWGASIRPQEMINDAMQAKNDPQMRPEFLQKSLNVFTAALEAWFDIEEFRRSDAKYNWTIADLAKLPIKWYGGTDLSKLYDLTAACLFGHYQGVDIIVPHCWFPRTAAVIKAVQDEIPLFGWMDEGWLDMSNDDVINHSDVVRWYEKRKAEGFRIRRIGHDRKFCREYFLEMQKKHFPIKDQPQTFIRKSEGFRYIEASAKRGTLYYCHAEPFEYCVQNVQGIEKTDDMVQYSKIADHLRIDVFDCAVFAACAYLEEMDRSRKAEGWV